MSQRRACLCSRPCYLRSHQEGRFTSSRMGSTVEAGDEVCHLGGHGRDVTCMGKTIHGAGSFSRHVHVDLCSADGTIVRCFPGYNDPDFFFFRATGGGRGLTGISLRVRFRILRSRDSLHRQTISSLQMSMKPYENFESHLEEPTPWRGSIVFAKGAQLAAASCSRRTFAPR